MSGTNPFDFNGAEPQRVALGLIPAGTQVRVRLTVRPGGAGPEGWLTQSKTSEALYLDTEAMVLNGAHEKRRIYTRIGQRGRVGQGVEDVYANRGRTLVRGMLESARGVQAGDTLERARAARTIQGYGELNGLEFVAVIGIEKDRTDPGAEGRNVIAAAIGPDHAAYGRLMGAFPVAAAHAPLPSTSPAPTAGGAPTWAAPSPQPAAGADGAPSWAR